MTRYLGLEIEDNWIRCAVFEGSIRKYALVDFVEAPIEGETDEERKELAESILSDLMSSQENRRAEVVSSFHARRAILREISIPYTRDDLIAKTIRFEAESYLHSHAIEDVVIEYLKCSEGEESSRLILCAVLKDRLQEHFDTLKKASIDPVVVELDTTALATSFMQTPLYSGEQNVLLIDVEESGTQLVFLERDRVVKIRSIWNRAYRSARRVDGAVPATESTVSRDIEQRFQEIERSLVELDQKDEMSSGEDMPFVVVSDDAYEDLLQPSGSTVTTTEAAPVSPEAASPVVSPGDHAVAVYHDDPVERICVEIERTFAAYALGGSIDLMVVTGSRAAELDVRSRVALHFETDVVDLDLTESFPCQWEGDPQALNQRGAVACGLALRSLQKGATEFDLRKDEFRFERRFERLMPSLTVFGMIFCLLSFLWSFDSHLNAELLQEEVTVLRERQAKMYEGFFSKKPSGPNYSMAAKRRLKELSQGSSGKVKKYLSAFELLQDVTAAIARTKPPVYPVFTKFDLQTEDKPGTKSIVAMNVKTEADKQSVVTALRSSRFFTTRPQEKLNEKDGVIELTVELKLKGQGRTTGGQRN